MGKYNKLGHNTALFMIANFAQKILGFIFVPIYTAVLSTEEYGTADLIITLISMMWPVCTIVINEACFRYLLDKTFDKKQVISIGFWVNILGIVCFFACLPIFLYVSNLREYYLLMIVYFIFYTFDSFLCYTIRGLEKVQEMVVGGIVNTVVTVSCNLFFLLVLKWNIVGYLLSYICGMFIADVLYIVKARIYINIIRPSKIDRNLLKKMVKYSLPMMPNSISWWISNSSDRILITYFCGVSMNGIYSVACKIPSLLSVISSVFVSAWQISSVEEFGTEANRKFFSDVYSKFVTINIIGASVLVCFIKVISYILFSKDFFEAYKIAPYLLLGAVFKTISAFLGTIYTTAKKTKMLFYSTLAGAVLNIILNIIFLKKIGTLGAAIATMISYFTVWLVRVIDTRKILKLDVNFKKEILAYVVIFVQILIWTLELSYSYLYEFILVGVILFIEKNEWLFMLEYGIIQIKSRLIK